MYYSKEFANYYVDILPYFLEAIYWFCTNLTQSKNNPQA